MDDKKIISINKFIDKLGSIIGHGQTRSHVKLKGDSSSQQSYSNLSTVDMNKS